MLFKLTIKKSSNTLFSVLARTVSKSSEMTEQGVKEREVGDSERAAWSSTHLCAGCVLVTKCLIKLCHLQLDAPLLGDHEQAPVLLQTPRPHRLSVALTLGHHINTMATQVVKTKPIFSPDSGLILWFGSCKVINPRYVPEHLYENINADTRHIHEISPRALISDPHNYANISSIK